MGLPASTYTSLSSHCSWSGLCKTSVRTMIRKLINIFSLPLNKIQTWTIGCYDLAPALHYLWSSILFSLELFVSTTAGCMLFLKQMKPLFFVCPDQHILFTTTGTLPLNFTLFISQISIQMFTPQRSLLVVKPIILLYFPDGLITLFSLWISEIAVFCCYSFASTEWKLHKDLGSFLSCSLHCAQDLDEYMKLTE